VITKTAIICNKLGLHARAASNLIRTSQEFGARICIRNGTQEANGKSIMSVLMLQATIGTELSIEAEGDDEERAVDAIVKLIENRFGEDE
jgi:phosphotransferase system HPr (HPr) family protein